LMIFGQGVIRCHPYLYTEIEALKQQDVVAFDRSIWHHLGSLLRNSIRAVVLGVSRGRLVRSPMSGEMAPYFRRLAWASAIFAILSDVALLSFGGNLKRQEKLTGRFADVLSWLYLGTATLRRFQAEGQPAADRPYVHWSLHYAFAQIQVALEGICANWSTPWLSGLLRAFGTWMRLNPLGMLPSDQLGSQVAQGLKMPGDVRDRLTANIFIPVTTQESLGRLEHALDLINQAKPILARLKAASLAGQLPAGKPERLIAPALIAGLMTATEAQLVLDAELARKDAIQVDAFTFAEYASAWQIHTHKAPDHLL
jgi:acyl-CoA dehydrogenase